MYGTTDSGGANGLGTVFRISPSGTLTTVYSFCAQRGCTDGSLPVAGLIQATDGNFYGTTDAGGSFASGNIFKITPGGTLTTLYSFCAQSCGGGSVSSACSWPRPQSPLPAQTFTTLHSFAGYLFEGANPFLMSLVEGTDGNLYGTTRAGGTYNSGTVFKMTPSGTVTTLDIFSGGNQVIVTGLVLGRDGNLYGVTSLGGTASRGSVFKVTPSGTLTTLFNFSGPDGDDPQAPPIEATNGNFYGTTVIGGPNSSSCPSGCGEVFKMSPAGALTRLYRFCSLSGCSDGAEPVGGLVQASDSNFYGTTENGGGSTACEGRCGTVFKITSTGTLTTLHSFDGTDGEFPEAALVQATDGNFYGTTSVGGKFGGGTVFKITPEGTFTTLYSFCSQPGCDDGSTPFAPLIQATDGNLYGTTVDGGVGSNGTIFSITPKGALTTLHSFDVTDGGLPHGGLFQATDGNLYGTTNIGGTIGYGTAFSLGVGLAPFVETVPTSGKVGGP